MIARYDDIYDLSFGPAETWPAWTDLWRLEDGAPLCFAEEIPDRVEPDSVPADDVEGWIESTEADPDDLADYLERLRFEDGCNARFAPDCRR